MTKERLEELIKQGATIWSSGFNEELKLNPKNCKIEKQKWLTEPEPKLYLVVKEDEEHYPTYCLDNLREDVDRVKWEHDMYTERTERFEPPMWEDIEDRYEFDFMNDCGDYKFNVIKSCMIEIIIHRKADEPTCFEWLFDVGEYDCTKENYEKACGIVRDLFKGSK